MVVHAPSVSLIWDNECASNNHHLLCMQALEAKHMHLLLDYSDELESVKDAFHYTRDTPVLPKNAARHSGAIKWVRGLMERIEAPMDKIRALNKLVLDTEEARRTLADHTALVQAMKEFEEEHAKAWVSQVSQVCRAATCPPCLSFSVHPLRTLTSFHQPCYVRTVALLDVKQIFQSLYYHLCSAEISCDADFNREAGTQDFEDGPPQHHQPASTRSELRPPASEPPA